MSKHLKLASALAAVTLSFVLVAACAPPSGTPGNTPSSTTSTTSTTTTTVTAADLSGRIVDSITGKPVPGATVLLTNASGIPVVGAGGPIGFFDATADASGNFGIPSPPAHFFVYVAASDHEGGLTFCTPFGPYFRSVEQVFTGACLFSPGDAGTIPVDSQLPHTFTGLLRDSSTLQPVVGAKVVLTDNGGTLSDTEVDFTDASGKFSLSAAPLVDDIDVYVDGSGVGYESGYVGCSTFPNGDKKVVATFANSCTFAPIDFGLIGVPHL